MLVLSCNLHHSLQLRTLSLSSQLRAHTRVLESAIWEKKSYRIQVTLYLFFRFELGSASVDMSVDSVSNSMYMSERSTADRNFCLGYMMQEKGAFQVGKFSASAEQKTKYKRRWEYVTYCTLVLRYSKSNFDASCGIACSQYQLTKHLELYFQCCSITCRAPDMACIAATLANGGKVCVQHSIDTTVYIWC